MYLRIKFSDILRIVLVAVEEEIMGAHKMAVNDHGSGSANA